MQRWRSSAVRCRPRFPMKRSSGTSLKRARRPGRRSMRAVIDTNILISAAIRPAGVAAKVWAAFEAAAFDMLISVPLFEELASVLSRPATVAKYQLSAGAAARVLALLGKQAVMIEVAGAT